MEVIAFLVVLHYITAIALCELDIGGVNTLITEFVADDSLCNFHCLFGGGVFAGAVLGTPSFASNFICSFSFFLCNVVVASVSDFVESFSFEDFEVAAPKGRIISVRVGGYFVRASAYDDFHSFEVVFIETVDIDSDDFFSIGEVNLSDFALVSSHRVGVNDVTFEQVFVDDFGVSLVDAGVLHCMYSFLYVRWRCGLGGDYLRKEL